MVSWGRDGGSPSSKSSREEVVQLCRTHGARRVLSQPQIPELGRDSPYGAPNTHTCTHAYVYMYTDTHTRVHVHIHTVDMLIHVCACTHVYVCADDEHMCVHACMCIYTPWICLYTRVRTHVYITQTHIHVYTCTPWTCLYVCVHAHVYMCTGEHTCMCAPACMYTYTPWTCLHTCVHSHVHAHTRTDHTHDLPHTYLHTQHSKSSDFSGEEIHFRVICCLHKGRDQQL